jgi:arsenite-transporting ATPase
VPRPRTILYTGKGGVGKTSVAAATALRCAAQGLRTVLISTDPAHSLSDALELELGPEPTPIRERLWGQEVLAQREMEAHWARMRRWLAQVLADRGVLDIAAEELTVPPGMDELFSLLQIKRHTESGEFDVIVVDCAPTGETLRLLSFPEIARWWLEKVFPLEGRMLAAARPFARTFLDLELPGSEALEEVHRLVANLIAMNEILRDRERASVRLVINPDRMVIREAQRTFTYLSLYGFLTDAVVVNRVLPDEASRGYFADWHRRQRERLREVADGFAPVPVLTARHFPEEVLGMAMLERLGDELFGERPAAALMHEGMPREIIGEPGGGARLRISVPFAERSQVSLKQIGAELVVSAGRERRTIILPPALARRRPAGARLVDGALEVSFEDGHEPAAQPR